MWELRQVWGSKRLLVPGVALIVTNPEGRIWMGLRSDSHEWSYFGGAMELGDSVLDTARKEMLEETGIETSEADWTFVGVHSVPAETNFSYSNGDEVQIVNHLFTMTLEGGLGVGDDEHTEFRLFDLEDLPEAMKADSRLSLELYKTYLKTGKVQVK